MRELHKFPLCGSVASRTSGPRDRDWFACGVRIFAMRCHFTLCFLAAAFVCLHAAPTVFSGSEKYWTDCTKSSDHGKINSVTINPFPPVKGQEVHISANATIDEEVTGGTVTISLKYGFLPVYDHTLQLCDLIRKIGKTCPIPRGITSVSVGTKLPTAVPKGDYSGNAVAKDQKGQELFCINFNINF